MRHYTRDSGIIDRLQNPISFSHRIVQEYFTALSFLMNKSYLPQNLEDLINNPLYWQTLALYAGLLSISEKELFISTILGEGNNPVTFACAVACFIGDNQLTIGPINEKLLGSLRTNLNQEDAIDPQLAKSVQDFLAVGSNLAANFIGRLLVDESPMIRKKVLNLLRYSDSSEAIRILSFIGLDDENAEVASEAADSLIAKGESILWPLIRQLYARKERTRNRAANTLKEIAASEAINYLFDCDIDDELAGKVIASCAMERVGRLLIALVSSNEREKFRSLMALQFLSDPRIFEPIIRMLFDDSLRVRKLALIILENKYLNGEENNLNKYNMILATLIGGLTDTDKRKAEYALDHVVGMKDTDSVSYILDQLDDKDIRKINIVITLSAHGREDMNVVWLKLIKGNSSRIKIIAIEALKKRGGFEIINSLIETLEDKDWDVCRAAVESLRDRPGKNVTEALIKTVERALSENLVDLGEETLCAKAIRALKGREGDEVTNVLLKALKDDDLGIRRAATDALEGREGSEIIKELLKCLVDGNSGVRHAAVKVLARLEYGEITRSLLESLKDENEYVSEAV